MSVLWFMYLDVLLFYTLVSYFAYGSFLSCDHYYTSYISDIGLYSYKDAFLQEQCEQCVVPGLGKLRTGSTESGENEIAQSLETAEPGRAATLQPDISVTVAHRLNSGLYGETFVVVQNHRRYIAKEYRIGGSLEDLKGKFEGLLDLEHENIVTYCGVCCISDTNRSVVIMEGVHQNLETFIEGSTTEIEPHTKLSILSNIADGLTYLHSQGIIHCDLIPNNVLLTAELTAKITDYGNSRVKSISDMCVEGHTNAAYVRDYLSPEALEGEYVKNSDVFSFGHLSIYIVIQHRPHPLKTERYRLYGVLKARTEVERREDFIREMREKINSGNVLQTLLDWTMQCLEDEVHQRPAIGDFQKRCV